jgi:hypothetical protein
MPPFYEKVTRVRCRRSTVSGSATGSNARTQRKGREGSMTQTQTLVIVVLVLVVVAALAIYVWALVRRRRKIAAMTPEERELRDAQKQYEQAVALAEKTLQITAEAWEKPIRSAEQALANAHAIGSRALGSYEGVRLFEDHIETPQGAFRFENGAVEATVDTARNLAGNKESVLSRANKEVFQELISRSSKPEGTQTSYLLVETPIFVTLVRLRAGDEANARQFSLGVIGAAGSVAGHEEERRQAVAWAQADLDRVRADRKAAIDAAQIELDKVKANTQRVDAAREAVGRTARRSRRST